MSDRLDFYSVPVPYRGKIHFRHNYCFEFNYIMAHESKYSMKLLRDTFKKLYFVDRRNSFKVSCPKIQVFFHAKYLVWNWYDFQSFWYEVVSGSSASILFLKLFQIKLLTYVYVINFVMLSEPLRRVHCLQRQIYRLRSFQILFRRFEGPRRTLHRS